MRTRARIESDAPRAYTVPYSPHGPGRRARLPMMCLPQRIRLDAGACASPRCVYHHACTNLRCACPTPTHTHHLDPACASPPARTLSSPYAATYAVPTSMHARSVCLTSPHPCPTPRTCPCSLPQTWMRTCCECLPRPCISVRGLRQQRQAPRVGGACARRRRRQRMTCWPRSCRSPVWRRQSPHALRAPPQPSRRGSLPLLVRVPLTPSAVASCGF